MAQAKDQDDNTPVVSQETLHRLLNKQDQEAEVVRFKQKQLTKFKEDYEALYSRLSTITDKVSHEVFVPMGRLAFFPGRVKHTNEIMVLLGENWFVERSAKQAQEIVQRRLKHCDETLKGFAKELKLLGGWNEQAKKLQQDLEATQGVDITYHEREDEVDGWREEHRRRVREYKKKLAEEKLQNEAEARHPRTGEEALWRHLDELELREELQDELDLIEGFNGEEEDENLEEEEDENVEDEEEDEQQPMDWNGFGEKEVTERFPDSVVEPHEEVERVDTEDRDAKSRRVTWGQEDSVRKFHRDDVPFNASRPHEGEVSGEEGENAALKITFKHSKSNIRGGPIKPPPQSDESSTPSFPTSPSDIYRQFGGQPDAPKSILKVKKCTAPVNMMEMMKAESNESAVIDRNTTGPKIKAVSDEEVKEREGSAVVAKSDGASTVDDEVVNTHRPVSRFKASRLRNNLPNL